MTKLAISPPLLKILARDEVFFSGANEWLSWKGQRSGTRAVASTAASCARLRGVNVELLLLCLEGMATTWPSIVLHSRALVVAVYLASSVVRQDHVLHSTATHCAAFNLFFMAGSIAVASFSRALCVYVGHLVLREDHRCKCMSRHV